MGRDDAFEIAIKLFGDLILAVMNGDIGPVRGKLKDKMER